jgi:transglutaminase-like putative cysteine protease
MAHALTSRPTPPEASGYLAAGPFTDPRDLAGRLARLASRAGDDPAALAEAVRSVMVHVFWRDAYGVPEDRARSTVEVNLRDVRSKLARIGDLQEALGRSPDDVSPLPPAQKLIGNCRDHSVLYAALLRTVGVPARARCGFARYFEAGKWIDHWVVERWQGGRWVIGDAQLDDLMRERRALRFDPIDLPDGEFVSGGEAWLACRAGDDPGRYGILEFWGLDFVKGNLVRDVNALAGRELLPWDCWGVILEPAARMGEEALAALDEVARATPMRTPLTAAEAAGWAGRAGLGLPHRIVSFHEDRPEEVDLGPILER